MTKERTNCAGETAVCPTCGRLPCVTRPTLVAADDRHLSPDDLVSIIAGMAAERRRTWRLLLALWDDRDRQNKAVRTMLPLVLGYRDAIEATEGEAVADAETRDALQAAATALGQPVEQLLEGKL